MWAVIEPILVQMRNDWIKTFDILGDYAAVTIDFIIDVLYGLTEFIAGIFTGDLNRAIGGIESIFDSFAQACIDTLDIILGQFGTSWSEIGVVVKNAINGIIGSLNGMIRGMVSGINAVVRSLNKLSFDIPDWVPSFGGKKFGFNIKTVTAPQIPYLAKGAVIPPNAPFMAMLGDQRHGTNVEAPLTTIQEAVAVVMSDVISAMLAGDEALLQELQELRATVENIQVGDSTIGEAADRYARRMALRTGGST